MNNMQHTPGPWEVSISTSPEYKPNGLAWDVCLPDGGDMLADLRNCNNAEANAILIATAPELLATCKCALADLQGIIPEIEPDGNKQHPGWKTIKELKNVITKTEG